MAITGNDIGVGANTTSVTSVDIVPNANCTAGAMVVLAFYCDNAETNGGDPFNTITDGHGNTWTSVINALRDPGAANAGLALRIFTTLQDVSTLTTGSTITIDFGGFSVSWCAWTITEFTSSVGYVNYVTGNTATGIATNNTIVSGSITSGNVVFVAQAAEAFPGSMTGDSDTTNGNWSAEQFGDSGGGILSQYKITTGTGTQSHNANFNGTTTDYCAAWIELNEIEVVIAKDPFGQFGFFGI